MSLAAFNTCGETATLAAGEALAGLLEAGDTLLLSGDLGAGKTQLTKGLAHGLGVVEPVTSPTFNMMLVHEGRLPLYHFDLYRLDAASELEDLDYVGTLEAGGVSVVEWGDRFEEARPSDGLLVRIMIESDDERRLEIEALGERGTELARAWVDALEGVEGVDLVQGSAT